MMIWGHVNIGLKDATFQTLSLLWHMTELYNILLHTEKYHPFLMLYTDGGPDYKITFLQDNNQTNDLNNSLKPHH
jgi:hypothetical protein